MMNFTVEETNLICIYKTDTRPALIGNLQAARPYAKDDPDMLAVLDSAARKLAAMTDADFLTAGFEPAAPVLYDEDKTEGFAYGE